MCIAKDYRRACNEIFFARDRGIASGKKGCFIGKPEAFRHVLRQSRDSTYRPVKLVNGRMKGY
jgi:hypothetical protein